MFLHPTLFDYFLCIVLLIWGLIISTLIFSIKARWSQLVWLWLTATVFFSFAVRVSNFSILSFIITALYFAIFTVFKVTFIRFITFFGFSIISGLYVQFSFFSYLFLLLVLFVLLLLICRLLDYFKLYDKIAFGLNEMFRIKTKEEIKFLWHAFLRIRTLIFGILIFLNAIRSLRLS